MGRSGKDEEFEQVHAPAQDLEKDGFINVAEAAGRPSVPWRPTESLPEPVAHLVNEVAAGAKRTARQVASTPQLTLKASSAAMQAVTAEIMNSNPLLPQTYNPSRYLVTAGAAFGATVLGVGVKQASGLESIDHAQTITAAEMHLAHGAQVFSTEQKTVVRQWVAEARGGLKTFLSTKPSAPSPSTESGQSARGELRSSSGSRKPATFGQLLEDATKISDTVNPDHATLLAQAPELAHTLRALEKFLTMPAIVHKTSRSEVQQRFEQDNIMGSQEFIESLKVRGNILADNAHKEAVEQNKKIMIAISGPGTGKTTNIKKMAAWINQPLCMLSGEEFCKMEIGPNQTAFSVFEAWVQSRVTEHMQIGGVGGINGLILLDDFHFALEENGPFARDSASRTKFFNFLKCIGDANQENIVSAKELAPGKLYPMNLSRIQVLMSLNRLPREFGDHGEVALSSRSVMVNVAYPVDSDRKAIAFRHCGDVLKREIADHFGLTLQDVEQRIDQHIYTSSILALAGIDIEFAKKHQGQLGFRALKDLLDRYAQHVKAKLGDPQGPLDADIFSFAGPTAFDPSKVAEEIKDYRKGADEDLVRMEQEASLSKRVNSLIASATALPAVQKDALASQLKSLQVAPPSKQQQLLDGLERQIQFYRNRAPLPDAHQFGADLKRNFGYLRAESANDETDRFESIATVAKELFIRRAAATTVGYRNNKLIRVKFIDPSSSDPTIYGEIASLLGGLPVHFLTHPDQLLAPPPALPTITSKMVGMGGGEYIMVNEGAQSIASLRTVFGGGKTYAYLQPVRDLTGLNTTYILNNEGFEEAMKDPYRSFSVANANLTVWTGKSDFRTAISIGLGPELSLFDTYLQSNQNKTSAAEGLIVVWVDKQVLERMEQWRSSQPGLPPDKSTRELFEQHLHGLLNQPQMTLSNGKTFDPRSLTVFLLDDSLHNAAEMKGDANFATVMTLGVPPILGRKNRALHVLSQALEAMTQEALENALLFGKPSPATMQLGPQEMEIFSHLVEWDVTMATRARQVGYNLPTSLLETCVQALVRRVADRKSDYFGLNEASELPAASAFEREWSETYRLHMDVVDSIVTKLAEKEAKIASEKLASTKGKGIEKSPKKIAEEQVADADEQPRAPLSDVTNTASGGPDKGT